MEAATFQLNGLGGHEELEELEELKELKEFGRPGARRRWLAGSPRARDNRERVSAGGIVAPESVIQIVAGTALLCLGRRLFWLFVGVVGFLAGMEIAGTLFRARDPSLVLTIALVAGAVGAVLAIVVQKIAIALAGFGAGAYVVGALLRHAGAPPAGWIWIACIVGGIIAAVLILSVFDWALIGLSSLSGAFLVTDTLRLRSATATLVVLGLTIAGVLIQGRRRRQSSSTGS